MNEEQRKAWGTLVFEIQSSQLEGYFFDVGNVHKPAILAAAAELTRLRLIVSRVEDVEGMAKVVRSHLIGSCISLPGDNAKIIAAAILKYLEGK